MCVMCKMIITIAYKFVITESLSYDISVCTYAPCRVLRISGIMFRVYVTRYENQRMCICIEMLSQPLSRMAIVSAPVGVSTGILSKHSRIVRDFT